MDTLALSETREEVLDRQPLPARRFRIVSERPSLSPNEQRLADELTKRLGKNLTEATPQELSQAIARETRNRLIPVWRKTQEAEDYAKRAVYASIEWLPGPHMFSALHAAKIYEPVRKILYNSGINAEAVLRYEKDPALGNGGLGRLAACLLDSCAALHLPVSGAGLLYRNGMFLQKIVNGQQEERDNDWMRDGEPWGIVATPINILTGKPFMVKFGGCDEPNGWKHSWIGGEETEAHVHDIMFPSYDGEIVNTLRLWTTAPNSKFSDINERLYPSDKTREGQELRLRQEYFLASTTMQDILNRHLVMKRPLNHLPQKIAVQLNDTHPVLAGPELMRLLVDEHGMDWNPAISIMRKVFAYTNHTLKREALEEWNMELLQSLLPRHASILKELQDGLTATIKTKLASKSSCEQDECIRATAIISEIEGKAVVKMGNLATYAVAGKINGVSQMHTELVADKLFPEVGQLYGESFISNHTNGISPRRWLLEANPRLAELLTQTLGKIEWASNAPVPDDDLEERADLHLVKPVTQIKGNTEWVNNLPILESSLEGYENDPEFLQKIGEVKLGNKQDLATYIEQMTGIKVDPRALFDVHVKRIHEYKRQLMNVFETITLYHDILEHPEKPRPKVVKIFAGLAHPDYKEAKDIIGLIHWTANQIHHDPRIRDRLKIVFLEDYNVSKAQMIFAAADISEQISTAGEEASGTGNMKSGLNGAVIIGTEDGANVEIMDRVGEKNFILFGHSEKELSAMRNYSPRAFIPEGGPLDKALKFVLESPFADLARTVLDKGDKYRIAADFSSHRDSLTGEEQPGYWQAQELARTIFLDPEMFNRMRLANIRGCSNFTSDTTIKFGYVGDWGIEPLPDLSFERSRTPVRVQTHTFNR